jgi:hypothetical protein
MKVRVEIPVAVAAAEPLASAEVASVAQPLAVAAASLAEIVDAVAEPLAAAALVIREDPVIGVNLLVDEPAAAPAPAELAEKMVRFATPVLPPSPEPHDLVTYDL